MSDNLFDDFEIGRDNPIEKKPGTFEPDDVTMPDLSRGETEPQPQGADSPVFSQATMDAALKRAQEMLDQQALKEMAARLATPVPPVPVLSSASADASEPVAAAEPEMTEAAVVTVAEPTPTPVITHAAAQVAVQTVQTDVQTEQAEQAESRLAIKQKLLYAGVVAAIALLGGSAYLFMGKSDQSTPAVTFAPAVAPASVEVAPAPIVEPVVMPAPAEVTPAPEPKPATKPAQRKSTSTLSKEDMEFLKTLNNAL